MNYKVIEIESEVGEEASTEMRFAVASERAGGAELLRIDIPYREDKREYNKLFNFLLRTLKAMKEERLIQFFATEKSFSESSTEAEFLLNKFPSVFLCGLTDNEAAGFIYIKI